MKPIKPCTLPGIQAAREELENERPYSVAEIAEQRREHARLVAAEMARAEAARQQSLQLDLGEAA